MADPVMRHGMDRSDDHHHSVSYPRSFQRGYKFSFLSTRIKGRPGVAALREVITLHPGAFAFNSPDWVSNILSTGSEIQR